MHWQPRPCPVGIAEGVLCGGANGNGPREGGPLHGGRGRGVALQRFGTASPMAPRYHS
jgi:hypothetical protein